MPLIQYNRFVDTFLPGVDPETQASAFFAYRSMLSGIPLSAMFSGKAYYRIRSTMVAHDLIRSSTDYVPITSFATAPRLFPVGERFEFDIYNKKKYVRKGKSYTIQIHFDVWFPLGVIRTKNYAEQLFALFFPIADMLFSRINVGASVEEMVESQNVDFTLGIVSATRDIIRNIATWSIIVTKYETSRVTSYVYDFVVKYRWEFKDIGGGTYNADMCYLHIANARSCATDRDLYTLYNETYREYTGRDKPYYEYSNVFTNCTFTFSYLRPTRIPLCRTNVDTKLYAIL
jgi:hypothetical protein